MWPTGNLFVVYINHLNGCLSCELLCCCCRTVRNPARNDGAPPEAVQAEDHADGRDATGDNSENVINQPLS